MLLEVKAISPVPGSYFQHCLLAHHLQQRKKVITLIHLPGFNLDFIPLFGLQVVSFYQIGFSLSVYHDDYFKSGGLLYNAFIRQSSFLTHFLRINRF